jgi:hypothetical protein
MAKMNLASKSFNTNSQILCSVASRIDSRAERLPLNGLYYGVSNNEFGQRAWLLRFDSKMGEASLYSPPEIIKVSSLSRSPDGRLVMRSDVSSGGVTYEFDGVTTEGGFSGVFHLSRANKKDLSNFKVDLWRLEDSSSKIGGVYSSVSYNEEGGDLVGYELILVPNNQKPIGVFVSYENDIQPYALTDVNFSTTELSFNIHTRTGEESYRGRFSAENIELRRDDADADMEEDSIIIPKLIDASGVSSSLTPRKAAFAGWEKSNAR